MLEEDNAKSLVMTDSITDMGVCIHFFKSGYSSLKTFVYEDNHKIRDKA